MLYFSYGSNMSSKRLKSRVPSASFVTTATLFDHDLRFHKKSIDGSSKCDALCTGNSDHKVIGVVFDICQTEKPELDRKEGLGYGYDEKTVELLTHSGEIITASTYYAISTANALKPYHWYKQHVLIGANEYNLPEDYVQWINTIESIADPNPQRHQSELAIYNDKEI